MKSSSAVLLALCFIFTILGMTCAQNNTNTKNDSCIEENNLCKSDNDCCSNICRLSFSFKKYCRKMKLLPTLISKFSLGPSAVPVTCVHNVSAAINDKMYETNGVLVAAADHGLLTPGTMVNVIMGNNTVELKIIPFPAKTVGTLELSETAANLLGMYGEIKPCAFQVPFWANHRILRRFMMLLPVSGIVYALYLFNQLNLY